MSKGLEIINLYENSNYLNTFHSNFMKDLQIVKKDLQRLESIDNAKPSEAMECLEEIIHEFNEPHYELSGEYSYKNELLRRCEDEVNTIKQALLKAQEDEELKVDICEMFGLDNLFPYNDTKAILKELEEYMGRKNQLWVDFMKTSKELKEQKKVLEIIKERQVDVFHLMRSETVEEYNKIWDSSKYCLTQEEFELLKAYFEKNIQK